MKRLAINGRFLTRRITGVERYASEIVSELDKMLAPNVAEIVVSEGSQIEEPLELENITVKRVGHREGHLWEQIDLEKYISRNNMLGLHLCMTAPVLNPGVVCIHDMAIRANPHFFDWKFVAWYRFMFRFLTKNAQTIVTVSEFSKSEIQKYYPAAIGKITVVPNAWQHYDKVASDDEIFCKLTDVKKGDYYFAMSSLAPNKNLKWVVETALSNPAETIVVAGGINQKVFGDNEIAQADNVIYAGYVSDEEAKALMGGSKGFLYPTFYEGFGIPPLEALSCGVPALVSDTIVMHEVYENQVLYVDPNKPLDNLRELDGFADSDYQQILNKYNWKLSAQKMYELLMSLMDA